VDPVLRVVTWLWRTPGFRSTYTAGHVNALYAAVRRHYAAPFEPVCVTECPEGLDDGIRVVPLWSDYRDLASPHGPAYPACYLRLKAFDPAMRDVLGPRFVSIDLDTVITGDLRPLWDRPEPFVIWTLDVPIGPKRRTTFQGSMWLLEAGAHPQVWASFSPAAARAAFDAGHHGNDQGFMQYVIGPQAAAWTMNDGVYSYKFQIKKQFAGQLPANARVVMFHGKPDPWEPEPQRYGWVRAHCPVT
jgi:hypothetical protein